MRRMLMAPALALALMPTAAGAQEDHSHTHSHKGAGPHFLDAFFTENAFLERKIRPDMFFLSAEESNLLTTEVEAEWAVTRRVSFIVHAPVHHLRPEIGSTETGLGDIAIGPKVALINDPTAFILAVGADFAFPTGDEDRGLGSGHAGAGPFALAWIPFGPDRRWLLQAASHVEIPFAADEAVHGEFATALSWTSPLGITPLVEGISEVPLEGGDPSWWVAPGVRWEFAPAWETGASARIPLTGPEADEQDFQLVFGFIRHFPLAR